MSDALEALLDFGVLYFALGALYTSGETGSWAALRKISIRAHSWFKWLCPINF
jgi:hypothetical protein